MAENKQVIARGAEAVLYLDKFEGRPALVKHRIEKSYRIKQIDRKLRKERTNHEAKLLSDARRITVKTPQVFRVDSKDHRIVMEFVQGERVKEFLARADRAEIKKVCRKIGESTAKLHSSNIIHGDLTTSNIIIHRDTGDIYFIDFGLGEYSKRIEDKGVDMKLLHDAIKAAHYNILKLCWRNILSGYRKEYKDAEKVIKKIDEIGRRARYA